MPWRYTYIAFKVWGRGVHRSSWSQGWPRKSSHTGRQRAKPVKDPNLGQLACLGISALASRAQGGKPRHVGRGEIGFDNPGGQQVLRAILRSQGWIQIHQRREEAQSQKPGRTIAFFENAL
jgi:hypothetical protein